MMYQVAGQGILSGESYPTTFFVCSPELEAGPMDRDALEAEAAIMLQMDLHLHTERQVWGEAVIYRIRDAAGQEIGRMIFAPGGIVPGLRVLLCRDIPGGRFCYYYLDPGWDLKITPIDGKNCRMSAFRTRPSARRPQGRGKGSKTRRGGPLPTSPERKEEIVSGWVNAAHLTSQAAYCADHSISSSTLRRWLHEQYDQGGPEEL